MPPKKTRNANAPNQHDKRHESGLAAPGRPIARKRSSGQLHDQSNGKPHPPPLPSTGLNGFRFPRPPPDSESTATDHAAGPGLRERDRTSSDASVDGVGPCGEMAESGHEHVSALMGAELSSATAGKNNHGQAPGTLSTVSTILTYYPLRDAISILILLLSLPPTLVLVIQTLFASLTFVPPTAGLSLATLPNIKEMFNSPNFGYPALATILFVDMVFWVLWVALSGWKPAQAVWLDLSQAVIAVSLSGAAASPGGPTHSIAICTLIVVAVHVLRYKAIHLTALDYLRSVLHKLDIGLPLDAPVFATSFHSATPIERGMALTAVRTILGIHIFSQGVTTCIRRYLASAKANEKDSSVPAITRTDTEATAGAEPTARSSTGFSDASPQVHSASSTDGRPPGQPPAPRDAKQRESSNKKKRKQANQVRSQQPLWAAIASTKVTFVKEMEQRDAADDGREAAAKDNNTTNHFASVTNTTSNRLWIYEVRDTEIHFYVELSPDSATENVDKDETLSIASAIDRTKPFYIRINGAAWSSARIDVSGAEEKPTGNRFSGEIFGLAPRSSYHCEIVGIASQRILSSASLITQPAPTAEQTANASTPPPHQSLRPASPITTLKQSIQSAEAKLNEARNRSRKTRKDQRAAHADIKKEINILRSKLESSGGVDERQERRLLQITQHKNQAEEATAELKAQLEAMGEIPSDEQAAASLKRRAWQSAFDSKQAADRDLENAKAEQEREINALKSEIAAAESKKEKLATRNTQRAQELEKLIAKQQAETTARQQRDMERDQIRQDRESRMLQLQSHINQMDSETQAYQIKAQEAYQQAANLYGWSSQPPAGYPSYSSPPTPEGVLPGSQQNGQISPQANGFPAPAGVPFGPHPQFGSPFAPSAQPALHANTVVPRGRSSSMLSQYSGFTDNGTEDPIPAQYAFGHQQTWPIQTSAGANFTMPTTMDRKFSDGGETSGSGSGSGNSLANGSTNGSNSPRPDARPFVPNKSVGTIGPPGKQKPSQSPTVTHVGTSGSGR